MTGRDAIGLLWASAGILSGVRWWRARSEPTRPMTDLARAARSRFGIGAEDRSARRLQAMRLAYAVGSVAVGAGLLTESTLLLGIAVVLLNVGTTYRYLVVALDQAMLAEPLLERPARGLLADVTDRLGDTSWA